MTYIAGETLIKTQIQAVTGFTNTTDKVNVVRGDKWTVLNSGRSDHYAVLRQGTSVREWSTLRQVTTVWRTVIEVVQRVTTDTMENNYDALLGYADSITARLDQYRKLADTTGLLRDANVTGGGEVKGIWVNQGDMPSWLMKEIYVDWTEESNVTFAE